MIFEQKRDETKSVVSSKTPKPRRVSWALGAIQTSYYTALGFSKTAPCATKGLPTPGQVTWPQNRSIMPSDGGLAF